MTRRKTRFVAQKATLVSLSVLGLAALCGGAWAQDAPAAPAPATDPAAPALVPIQPPADVTEKLKGPDITDKAMADRRLKRLVTAIQAAGLVETLKGQGPFTVFAPTDAAFSKIPQADWDALLLPENKEKLVSLLKYHVVAGKLTSADVAKLKDGDTLTTLQGGKITVRITNNRLKLGDADLVKTDIAASNGVIHQINAVLTPPIPKQEEAAPADVAPPAQEPVPAPQNP